MHWDRGLRRITQFKNTLYVLPEKLRKYYHVDHVSDFMYVHILQNIAVSHTSYIVNIFFKSETIKVTVLRIQQTFQI